MAALARALAISLAQGFPTVRRSLHLSMLTSPLGWETVAQSSTETLSLKLGALTT